MIITYLFHKNVILFCLLKVFKSVETVKHIKDYFLNFDSWGKVLKNSISILTDQFVKYRTWLNWFFNKGLAVPIWFIRFKIKGLGFRIRRYGQFLIRFFLGVNQYRYIHVPSILFARTSWKKIMMISPNKMLLFVIVWQLLSLKKANRYFRGRRAKGFLRNKSVRFLKKLKKYGQ